MRQTVLGYEQQFYINGTQISGVQSVDGSYSVKETPINVLGWGHVNKNFQGGNQYFGGDQGGFILDEGGFRLLQEQTLCDRKDSSRFPESLAVLSAPLEGSFSVNSMLVSEDFFLGFTGDNPFTGSIHHGNSYFGFNSGYITSHNVSCSVGQLPTTSTSIAVFGDIGGSPDLVSNEDDSLLMQENLFNVVQEKSENPGGIYDAKGDNPFPEIRVPNQQSMSVKIGGSLEIGGGLEGEEGVTTDRVTSFQHSINIPIEPIYIVGSSSAVQVDVIWPISTQTNITIEVDEYSYRSMRKYLRSPILDNIAIRIDDCFGNKIQHYTVKDARFASESMSASTDGRLTANLSYISYYNKR